MLSLVTGSIGLSRTFAVTFDETGHIAVVGFCADVSFPDGPVVNDGLWHSVVVTYNGAGTISIYIDRALVATSSSFTDTCGGALTSIQYDTAGTDNWLGTDAYGDKHYVGDLRNVLFYDYALSSHTIITAPAPV